MSATELEPRYDVCYPTGEIGAFSVDRLTLFDAFGLSAATQARFLFAVGACGSFTFRGCRRILVRVQ